MEKINRSYIRKIRYAVQWAVLLMVLYAGVSFYFFAQALEQGLAPSVTRSPSVEGFMPIGALMALKLWLAEGIFDPIHPAALVIFIGSLLLAVLAKKSFCGWICPVGTLSEAGWKAGQKAFGRNFNIHRYMDYPLRSLKYVLTAFFLYIILLKMSSLQIVEFLDTPYWKVADIKLLKFFTEMTLATKVTLSLLFGLSLIYKNFWCRYLCPYGGLLGLLSIISPAKITRQETKCINCGLCSKNCPSRLPVDTLKVVRSPECTGCLTCVSSCPAKDALDMTVAKRHVLKPALFAAIVIIVFFGTIAAGKLTGRWHSSVTQAEYKELIPAVSTLEHP